MQQRRNIYVNTKLPQSEYDHKGRIIDRHYANNRIRTAKYTLVSFVPKNLFEQFRNVANLYFLFLVVLQCIPIFGVTEPAVSALPLIVIIVITAIKDAIEDTKRSQSDKRVNKSKVLGLKNWRNVNLPEISKGRFHAFKVAWGFTCTILGIENKYARLYRSAKSEDSKQRKPKEEKQPLTDPVSPRNSDQALPLSLPKRVHQLRPRSDTLRSISRMLKPNSTQGQKPYRPGSIPHSVLYRTATNDTARRPSTVAPGLHCGDSHPTDPPGLDCKATWADTLWQDVQVGDYIKIRNNEDVPADVIVLSTSDPDNLCYVETQNLDGETNLKARQGLPGTSDLNTVHDCERARFYIESEPPHVNLYQYSGVLRWEIEEVDEAATTRSGVQHQKSDPVTYNNMLLRGCVLRNTEWVICMVVYTGAETKIMLNSGQTPSKRSKMAKGTNPHVIANFVILAIMCIVSSVIDSVQFNGKGSSRYFDFDIEGSSGSYSGFLTFWVTLILYQNIVPISLYISVEIVKTFAAYFIYSDIDMYYAPTDSPCIPKTWNISDDLGQIEYVFSDKTGTLTQNVMEFRKCTIDGVSYGLGTTEASQGARLRTQNTRHTENSGQIHDYESTFSNETEKEANVEFMNEEKRRMLEIQAKQFDNPHVRDPTFIDPAFFEDLGKDDEHSQMMEHFGLALALCHTAIPEQSNPDDEDEIEYKAQSPDEAALVGTARDLGFVFLNLNNKTRTMTVLVKGKEQRFSLLNVLEFNSTRKRMSVIVQPEGSDKIVLLCKGADSIIFERLCTEFGNQTALAESQARLRETTSDALEEFANEGLRTLCLSYRFIAKEEYTAWNKRFEEANSSIHGREEKIDEVCEGIEREMLLMGGTAIEDRLQEGVPETIAELSKSGIKLWVLTGDKTETAINIGFSCNLLTVDMELVIIKAQTRDETKAQIEEALKPSENNLGKKRALVIDGTTLRYALLNECKDGLLDLGMQCASVICCRVSPKQKAQVVMLVKKGLKVMTLAIGDGANDVAMIQSANVGVGISGVEGRQAVMASDYAIAQFRYLHKMLLVHGRWSYLRTAEMIIGFFFKNIVWTFMLFWYQIFCQFNGSMTFDYSLVTLYNLIFTSLPIIFLGIWDQDLSARISLRYPELYRMGLRNDKFKTWHFWLMVVDAIYQSAVSFFFPYMLFVAGAFDVAGFSTNGIYEMGTIMSSIGVCVANLFIAFSLYGYTWIQVVIIAASILVYYVFVAIYSQFNTFIFAGHLRLFGTGFYWLVLILAVVTCLVPRVAAKHILHQYYPYDNDIIREIELVLKNGREREAHLEQLPNEPIPLDDIKH
ncbi:hypothetical protein CLU79DRAFT_695464 [Phycomyces nitens]|nr:hypothetical protein CLU79DRAFT_695464 [Phycomyces nitens]